MKKNKLCVFWFVIWMVFVLLSTGCGEKKEEGHTELAVGNWTLLRNRTYILLITNPKGEWSSSVRIADATSKIVKSKGNAKGTWYIDGNQMVFSVGESDIEEIWEKNSTLSFSIISMSETEMHMEDDSGRILVWKKTNTQKAESVDEEVQVIMPMGPVVVNLNKHRSNDKDRYLCLNLNLVLKELMPDQEPPPIHPRAYDAAIIFLSSLVQNDVRDFDRIRQRGEELASIINPYLDGMIGEIDIEHVIVANDSTKVEEFIIEHTMVYDPESEEGQEQGEGSANQAASKDK